MPAAQAGLWVSDPRAYRERLFELLGDRDSLEVLGQTGFALADMVRGHSPRVLRSRPVEGQWTPNEIIGHLVDSEWVYGYRVRLILCELHPAILGTDQDLWVAGQRHNEREPSELVNTFRTLRQFNLALSTRLSPADLERIGQHNQRGPESLGVLLRMMAGHDLSHLDQIARHLRAVLLRA